MPDGSTGSNVGEGFFSAGLQINHVIAEDIQGLPDDDGVTGFSQGRLNDQSLLTDFAAILLGSGEITERTGGSILGDVSADEFSIDGHASSSSDSHAVQSEIDSLLRRTEEFAVTDVAYNPESWEANNGTAIDYGAISISNLNVGSQPSSSGSDRASSDSEIFKPQAVALGGLAQQPSFFGEGGESRRVRYFGHFGYTRTGPEPTESECASAWPHCIAGAVRGPTEI